MVNNKVVQLIYVYASLKQKTISGFKKVDTFLDTLLLKIHNETCPEQKSHNSPPASTREDSSSRGG